MSTSFADGKIITYYYCGDELVTNNDTFNNNTTIIEDDYLLNELHHVYVGSKLWTDEYVNITRYNIVIMNGDGETVYNTTQPFGMNNYIKESDLNLGTDDNNNENQNIQLKVMIISFLKKLTLMMIGK